MPCICHIQPTYIRNPITVNVTRESHIPVQWRELRCDSEFAKSNNRPWYDCGLQYIFLSQQEGDAQEPRRLNEKYVTHHEQSLDSYSEAPRRCRKLSSRHTQHERTRQDSEDTRDLCWLSHLFAVSSRL